MTLLVPTPRAATREAQRRANAAATAAAGTWLPATAGPAGLPTATGSARLLVHKEEGPLVVMVASLIEANRLVFALADDAHHSAGDGRGREGAAAAGTAPG